MRLAEKHHIAVVLGTPTDAPPAWLTTKYPETLRVDANGPARRARRPAPVQLCQTRAIGSSAREIAEQLAQRFGHDPNVIGWQIGNEYTDESFDPATRRQFQEWLQRRYGTLDALNQDWATAYWSQTYDRWDEIPLVGRRRQSRAAARAPALRQRHVARLPARAARRDSQVRRPAAVHHHQPRRPGLVRQLRPLRDQRAISTWPPGTTTSGRGI